MNYFFEQVLTEQCARHPHFETQDALKLAYQAAFGAEHLIADPAGAEAYFLEEYASCHVNTQQQEPLFEQISEEFCRVNLRGWKAAGLPSLWLFRLFLQSTTASFATAISTHTPAEQWQQHADTITALAGMGKLPFTAAQWAPVLASYQKEGVHPVHHSATYRNKHAPAYRLVHTRFLPMLPLLHKLANIQITAPHAAYTIAIDGRCGAGKTTLGKTLSALLETSVIQMDDFFLPPDKRTPARLSEAGGNLDYERFSQEVLPHLSHSEAFSYQRFDCASMQLANQITIAQSNWHLVEGSYSHHPYFKRYADLHLFVTIDPTTQIERILARNGAAWAEDFKKKWIPMEESYFHAYNIEAQADFILSPTTCSEKQTNDIK